jgi:hypothetical protein
MVCMIQHRRCSTVWCRRLGLGPDEARQRNCVPRYSLGLMRKILSLVNLDGSEDARAHIPMWELDTSYIHGARPKRALEPRHREPPLSRVIIV